MGNRAVITTSKRDLGVYLHWNGGRDSVETFLEYCRLKGYRAPSCDHYGYARLCQVIGNFFGGTLSLGILPYSKDKYMDPGDNGVYVIEGWKIVEHLTTKYEKEWNSCGMVNFPEDWEQCDYDLQEMLLAIDAAQPGKEQLGHDFITAEEVDTSKLAVGDKIYLPFSELAAGERTAEIVGLGKDIVVNGHNVLGVPYINKWGSDAPENNINNYILEKTVRIVR